MDDLKAVLARPIQLAEQVIKWAEEAQTFRQECLDLKVKVERLATLLRQAARADLYERPARRILDDTGKALDKATALAIYLICYNFRKTTVWLTVDVKSSGELAQLYCFVSNHHSYYYISPSVRLM
ncbi:hypothetical protein GUJ93_ZPchr0008g14015 [Zizania palustris]|uniref:DUF7792 domain-containing protein n=1 Tax=Zizania palustris TaxID=103762 RepID=A0A8J5RK13_ZIZPA|nr:hypothetical protein GUJ93_ZPchr0008g14015 [Zizania palustris]KAG8048202.1 hypothetical protein GUJ93_ZPchr0008g14015 [Zizania palustris]